VPLEETLCFCVSDILQNGSKMSLRPPAGSHM
jgi:hypothetical protein